MYLYIMTDITKYKWKNRLILLETPNYTNEKYKKAKEIYQENIQEFHKRYVKLLSKLNKNLPFKINLIGYDGKVKHVSNQIDPNNLFKIIDAMPMSKNNIKPTNLSLYSDYNPKNTITGLGFKDKEKALFTIERIKNEPIKYQKSVISTMIGRAKTHPHQTKDMRDAIKIFKKWLDENRNT